MIKFFRKIRKNLLNEGKTTRYFKYAVGEIVLVVIGILIALQINNWNEKRNQINIQKAIYNIIKEGLVSDIKEFQPVIKRYEEKRKPDFEKILNYKANIENQKEMLNIYKTFAGFEDVSINERGINLFNQFSSNSISIDEVITKEISQFYNNYITEIKTAQVELSDAFTDNQKYFQNFEWFSSFYIDKKMSIEALQFFANNTKAKNKLTFFYVLFGIYIDELKRFNTDAEALILEIDKYVKDK